MKKLWILLVLWTGAAAFPTVSQASTVVIINSDYNCTYMNENMTSDREFRDFLVNYIYGMVTGMNIQMLIDGKPGFDFSQIENPMMITWTAQVCHANPDMSIAESAMRMFNAIVERQHASSGN